MNRPFSQVDFWLDSEVINWYIINIMKMEGINWPLPVAEKHFDNASKVVAGLYNIPRTGWVKREVKNPETVGQHTDALIILAQELGPQIEGLDQKKLLRMLQIHDWPEHIAGDQVTASKSAEETKRLKGEKYIDELKAIEQICTEADLGSESEEIKKLWLEFEAGESPEASIAKQLDKLQAMIQAKQYEKQGEAVRAQDFIDHDRSVIIHPLLRQIMEKLELNK